ncbi:DHA2 family efflux MFS transporter permease subunit [Dyella mobilis]|uniref:DHA2 family efflux MFS transporter permease subunit n=1 Tax=Dyella mobilis TaxID=1849582 RepID=A0ABS2KK54_9GAMM|nr:DHA2 family efflux MFS transporter permease subunit [Dyella mobilis]MBM7131305.1 DHA2 family efflux MFS transporter permease subunit [Dyella mobilis]GLQ98759.1 MFS transporter [Dyella mobilis]
MSSEADELHPSIWKITSVAILGSFLAQLDATIANVSLSSLATELHTGLSTIQWVTSGYLLALTLALPLSGWLVDRMGAKAVYLWCFVTFTLSSALCGLAWSAPSLIAFRVLQGISGGLLAPMAQMTMARAAGKHMARVVGYAAVPVLLAPILGPVVAGLILQYASWRWLFLVNVPFGVLGLVLAMAFLPDDRQEIRPRQLDWQGLALLSPGLAILLYGSDRLSEAPGQAALLISFALLATFLWKARRKGERALIDLRLFQGKVFSAAAITQFLSNGALFAGQMLIPIYLIRDCGHSPAEMGWLLAPMGLGMLCTYPSMGALTKHWGIRNVSAGGALLALLGTLPLLYMADHALSIAMLTVALFIRGAGQSAVGIPSMSAAYASVERQALPMATTSLNIVQRLGGPMFTTLCASFLGWQLATRQPHPGSATPYALAFLLLCVLHGATAVMAWRLPRSMAEVLARRPADTGANAR